MPEVHLVWKPGVNEWYDLKSQSLRHCKCECRPGGREEFGWLCSPVHTAKWQRGGRMMKGQLAW